MCDRHKRGHAIAGTVGTQSKRKSLALTPTVNQDIHTLQSILFDNQIDVRIEVRDRHGCEPIRHGEAVCKHVQVQVSDDSEGVTSV